MFLWLKMFCLNYQLKHLRLGFFLLILNEDMNNIIKIENSLEDSDLLINGASETVTYEIKHKNVHFFLL